MKQLFNVKQKIEQFISKQTEISDLERIRMKNLDNKLGTNTHFHEIQSQEERLDSDNVMRRQVLARRELQKEKDLAVAHLFDPEQLYTQLVQIQSLKREETMKHRYFKLLDCYQNIPNYTYFSKDSKEGHPVYNLYKGKNERKSLQSIQ